MLFRIFLSFIVIILLEPQTPEWNPLIPKLRENKFFLILNYENAKKILRQTTWGIIVIFYFLKYANFY
uniref:Hypothetical chloroplast RF47 n=1 Tax=Tydemania expeditionis TaxID=325645 RepID=A0A0D6E1J7_TYDEX|nr:hypothetical chloroplast RF47 [Tydemania expeditionis]CEO91096.1 hypothetical chloroplast RF47 [Tydemania expeditionis]